MPVNISLVRGTLFMILFMHMVGAQKCTRGDCRDGEGRADFEDGATYEGEFQTGQFHGAGKMTYPDGDVYDGFWKKGRRHGKGEHKYPSGHVYEGDWRKDVPRGHGSYVGSSCCGPNNV